MEDEEFFLKTADHMVEFTLLAEGMRKLGLLCLLVRNGTLPGGSVLFWDEPEENLNPQLFTVAIDVLLKLQRAGVQVLMTTHRSGCVQSPQRVDRILTSPTWEIYERWGFVALARKLREWLPGYAWNNAGAMGSDRRSLIGSGGDGYRVSLHLQKTFSRTDGIRKNEAWSVSRQCIPDLVLISETRDGAMRFTVLDAKYRADEQWILNGMSESVHLYHDALRWGSRCPDLALLLVPNADEAKWLTREDYVDKHRVGVVALRPDVELPEWLRHLITAHAAAGPVP